MDEGEPMHQPYTDEFYAGQEQGSLTAARVVMPLVQKQHPARTIVDVGCGRGTWLRAASEAGFTTCHGYDGDYVDRSTLFIDESSFHALDLTQPFTLPRKYDLAMSLEVAEHLPASAARHFVQQLTRAAPTVVFSAAIPGQGGTHHINERWQDEWRELFAEHGYVPFDTIRPHIRGNSQVAFWYQQNIIIYGDPARQSCEFRLDPVKPDVSLNYVHPDLYRAKLDQSELYFTRAVGLLPGLLTKAITRRLRQAF